MYLNKFVFKTVRLYSGYEYIELDTTIGPIPFLDGLGKEIIKRYETDLTNNETFFTDANGLVNALLLMLYLKFISSGIP